MRGNKPFSSNFLNNRLARNNGGTIANAAVPEPATLLLLILDGGWLVSPARPVRVASVKTRQCLRLVRKRPI